VGQYTLHSKSPNVPIEVSRTIADIMLDEQWHIRWIRGALKTMESEYGADNIRDTLKRFTAADREVYARTITEHGDRLGELRLASK
jgi:hypothetical protein